MQAQRRTACVANPGCRREDRRLRRCKWQPALHVDWTVCRLPELYNHTLDTALFDVENPAFFTNVVSAVCWCSLACQGVFLPVCDAVCGVRALAGRQARECDSAKPDACAAAQGVRVSAIESPFAQGLYSAGIPGFRSTCLFSADRLSICSPESSIQGRRVAQTRKPSPRLSLFTSRAQRLKRLRIGRIRLGVNVWPCRAPLVLPSIPV